MTSPDYQPNAVPTASGAFFPVRFWVVLLFASVGAGLAGALLIKILRLVQHLAWHYRSGPFLDAVRLSGDGRRMTVLVIGGLVAGLALWLFNRLGLKESSVSRAVWSAGGKMPLPAAVYKGVLSIVLVGLGAAVGREAAPKEIGAALAAKFSDLGRLMPAQRRLLAACGAGAGMAAIYNVPFGGALFALEVLLGSLTIADALPVFVACFVATVTSWTLLPATPTYTIPVYQATPQILVFSLIAGPLAGCASAAYVRVIGKVRHARPAGISAIGLPLLVFALLGVASCRFPELLGNGKNVVQEAADGRIALPLVAGLLLLRPLATALCLRAGIPGGLFTPTLTFGALLGALGGGAWLALWPDGAAGLSGACAMIGAGAVLAAATLGPLSAIALMLELGTNTSSLIMPLLIAVTGATLTARGLHGHSIYSAGAPSSEAGGRE